MISLCLKLPVDVSNGWVDMVGFNIDSMVLCVSFLVRSLSECNVLLYSALAQFLTGFALYKFSLLL